MSCYRLSETSPFSTLVLDRGLTIFIPEGNSYFRGILEATFNCHNYWDIIELSEGGLYTFTIQK